MSNLKLIIVCCLFGCLLFTSCNKDEIEARKTAYFFIKNTSSTSGLTIYIEDKLIGELPIVSEGINNCSETTKGLKKLLDRGVNTIVAKNSAGEVVIDVDFELKKNGREVNIKEARKGTGTLNSFQVGGSETCLIIELLE